ncbi:MAG: DUF1080 domain-containing protein [Fuerstiella sp.]|nr:DUF1080 domain-containing protein [Fuerstiella sp.]
MKSLLPFLVYPGLVSAALSACIGDSVCRADDGFQSLFNGQDLAGWEGPDGAWTVADGSIRCTGRKDGGRNWLIWRGGEVADFELRLKVRFTSGNSGVQVRSEERDDFQVCGYQVEVASSDKMGLWHHSLSPEKYRSHLATAGQKGAISESGVKTAKEFKDPASVQAAFKDGEWNDMVIIARGAKLVQLVNGVVLAELIDLDAKYARSAGVLAFQDHGKGTVAEFKDIYLKRLNSNAGTPVFEDSFERESLGDRWQVPINSFSIRNGHLLGQEDPQRGHGAVVRAAVPFRNAVIRFAFRFTDGKNFNLVINDRSCKSVHAGHICRVSFSPARVRIADDKDGFMKNEIFDIRQDETRRAEVQKLLKGRDVVIPNLLTAGTWHEAEVTIDGDRISVLINGETIGALTSSGIAHPTKTDFGFTVTGREIEFDDVRLSAVDSTAVE